MPSRKPAKKTKPAGRVSPEKLDLYRLLKAEYAAPKDPVLLETAAGTYLTVCGAGKPGGELFQTHVGALFGAAYTIKMTKKAAGRDYKVCGLEGLWWSADGACITVAPQQDLNWKLLIRTPDFISQSDLAAAVRQLEAKKKPGVADVRLETIAEGRCVQVLHVGPYEAEGETVRRMQEFVAAQGLALKGPHHEIYLSDPRRVAPAKLRTILRYPVG